ncbi:MAG: NfeD family protein [Alphaproteobacteria bacterium]|nr:NfeD family protein [Alphaproteobacteria bacterium]
MSAWLIFLIVSVLFFIAEIFSPTMFFLNFAVASIITAFWGVFTENYNILIPIFCIFSIIFILFLRPLLNINPKEEKTHNFESQYIDKIATATTDINYYTGRISVYDENWEARTTSEDVPEIKKGSKVKIIRHNDLTMFVEKKGKK